MQKLELCLNLEMVDICLRFAINCIRAYRDSISVQLLIRKLRIEYYTLSYPSNAHVPQCCQ